MILNQELFERKSFAYFCGYQAIFFFVNSAMSFSHFPTQSFIKIAHYLNNECADMIYYYGLEDDNGNAASQMYRKIYPNRRHPSSKVIRDMFSRLKELGCFYTTASEQPLRRSIEDVLFRQGLELDRCN